MEISQFTITVPEDWFTKYDESLIRYPVGSTSTASAFVQLEYETSMVILLCTLDAEDGREYLTVDAEGRLYTYTNEELNFASRVETVDILNRVESVYVDESDWAVFTEEVLFSSL